MNGHRQGSSADPGSLPRVVIASLPKAEKGSTSIFTVTQAFMDGLADRYAFRAFFLRRRSGVTGGAELTAANLLLFFNHFVRWAWMLLRFRPAIAHFPVTSGWNIEKSLSMLMLARLFGARTIGHLHGGSFDDLWIGMRGIRRTIARWEFRKLDMLIVLGSYWCTWVVENLGLIPDRVTVVNNPIDAEFERLSLSLPLPGNPGVFFLGVVGRRKGVYDIVQAARILQESGSEVSIQLAGPEDERGAMDNVRKQVNEWSLRNVTLAGPVYGDSKIALFRQNGIFVFPSYNENFPLVVLEAAAAGRAIVTTRVGAIPEFFVENESVIFVDPGDAAQIAAAVGSLIRDDAKRMRLGSGAREVFTRRLSRTQILDTLDRTYASVLTPRMPVHHAGG
jgi:glycosyltransferase involved in cell wall biosynthesis